MLPGRVRRALSLYRQGVAIALAGRHVKDVPRNQIKSLPTRIAENLRWAHTKREANATYYLYGLHKKFGASADDFMSDRESMDIIRKQIRTCRFQHELLRDKLRFFEFLKEQSVNTPEIVYACSEEGFHHLPTGAVHTWQDVQREYAGSVFFAKPAGGFAGAGCGRLSFLDTHADFEGAGVTSELCARFMAERYVFQRPVVQHPALAQFNPDCLNTMRIVTIARGAGITDIVPLSGFFRIGAPGMRTDNWSSGGIAVPVDVENGVLSGNGIYKYRREVPLTRDPTSGVTFRGFRVPHLLDAIQLLCSLHEQLGGMRSVGWDLAIDETGPCVVEGNSFWGTMFPMAADPQFKRKYLEILAQCEGGELSDTSAPQASSRMMAR